jgi:ribosomal protein L28
LAICLKNYLTGNTVAHSSGFTRLAFDVGAR